MTKNDGWAEVREIRYIHQGPTSGVGWQVIINHFEGEPEIWSHEFFDKESAQAEADKWNEGRLGEKNKE